MKEFQIEICSFNDPHQEWVAVAETDDEAHAKRLAENLRPHGHLSRVQRFEDFATVLTVDAMGIVKYPALATA